MTGDWHCFHDQATGQSRYRDGQGYSTRTVLDGDSAETEIGRMLSMAGRRRIGWVNMAQTSQLDLAGLFATATAMTVDGADSHSSCSLREAQWACCNSFTWNCDLVHGVSGYAALSFYCCSGACEGRHVHFARLLTRLLLKACAPATAESDSLHYACA